MLTANTVSKFGNKAKNKSSSKKQIKKSAADKRRLFNVKSKHHTTDPDDVRLVLLI